MYIYYCLVYVRTNSNNFRKLTDIHNHDTRQKHNIITKLVRLEKTKQSPNYWGPILFNKLDGNTQKLPLHKFKIKIKQLLLENCYYSVSEFVNDYCSN